MVAPRARQSETVAAPAETTVPVAPLADTAAPPLRHSPAAEPASVRPADRSPQAQRQHSMTAPRVSPASVANVTRPEPLASTPAAPVAVQPPPAIATPGRGMAPSSLQAQAERLQRGAEPQRPIAFAQVGPRGAIPSGLRGPDPSTITQPQTTVANGAVAIQVGAYPTAVEAQRRLDTVRFRAGAVLKSATPAAEPVRAGVRTLYRARFTGLDAASAAAACSELRRQQIDCLVAR